MSEDAPPDWDRIERDVIRKLHLLRAEWEHTSKTPALHVQMTRDRYIPMLRHMAAFCALIEEEN